MAVGWNSDKVSDDLRQRHETSLAEADRARRKAEKAVRESSRVAFYEQDADEWWATAYVIGHVFGAVDSRDQLVERLRSLRTQCPPPGSLEVFDHDFFTAKFEAEVDRLLAEYGG